MTREELRDYVEEQRNLDIIPYHVYSTLIDGIDTLEQEPILDKIRTEIEQEIEQEKFARHVFRYEKIDAVKAEQCTGSISAYHNVIKLIDKYKADVEPQERSDKE